MNLFQIDNEKREKILRKTKVAGSHNKRGRPRGVKNKKIVISDDEDDSFEAPRVYKKVKLESAQASAKTKTADGNDGNTRQSSRIKAGMQSGKIVLATRVKHELLAEEEEDTEVTITKKSPPVSEVWTSVYIYVSNYNRMTCQKYSHLRMR